jgi:hypothetical protein
MTTMVDPPEGWRYGFPRAIPDEVMDDGDRFAAWLSQFGYPARLLPLALEHSRYWESSP